MIKIPTLTIYFLLICASNSYAGLAFVANVDGNWDLFVAGEDGKNLTQLTNTPYDEKTLLVLGRHEDRLRNK